MIARRDALKIMSAAGAAALISGCAHEGGRQAPQQSKPEAKHVRILATSDTHGMFAPWDYALDEEDLAGSMARLATAIKTLRDKNTLLVDAGDTIQGNMAEVFLAEEVHPMIACMNALGYDIGVTGNHEYNFGMDVVRRTIASFEGKVITGNVIDELGNPIADGSAIIEKGGVRVGLVGMVTPHIIRWDEANLEGCVVSDPVKETRKVIDRIKADVDVLVGVMHMGLDNEYNTPRSGVRDLAEACPEFDLIIAAHQHQLVEGEEINGVLVVENKFQGQTMSVVDLTLECDGDGWKVTDRSSSPVEVAAYDPDPQIVELMAPYDERAKSYAHEVIGRLEGGPLAPQSEVEQIPEAILADTAFIDLIHTVQLYHTNADVSATSLFMAKVNLEPGPIRRCDASQIYKYNNTLYTLEMTGAQLKVFLEQSAGFYRTLREGDLTVSFDAETTLYNYDMLQGVSYTIDISKEKGERIGALSWPNGTPVADDDTFVLVTNNYRATAHLLVPGVVFEEGNVPTLLQTDVHGYLGGIREMIADYIQNEKDGVITPECNDNWSLVEIDWDEELHARAVKLLADGTLLLETDDKHLPSTAITEADVRRCTPLGQLMDR